MTLLMSLLCIVLWTSAAWATAYIQYHLTSMHVTAASDETIPAAEGYGILTVTGAAADIVWPVPTVTYTGSPGACPTGSGHAIWTKITDPGAVTAAGAGMAIQDDRDGFFFAPASPTLLPGCYQVFHYEVLLDISAQIVLSTVLSGDNLKSLLNVMNLEVFVRCPTTDVSQDCVDTRANMVTLNAHYPSAASLKTLTDALVALNTNIANFKIAKGW